MPAPTHAQGWQHWIELVCGRVPVRLASQKPHTSRLSPNVTETTELERCSFKLLHECMASSQETTAQRQWVSKWTNNAHRICNTLSQQWQYSSAFCFCSLLFILFYFRLASSSPFFFAIYYYIFVLPKCNIIFKGITDKTLQIASVNIIGCFWLQ